uniref:Protein kinase domain-containing protein n=2 Tax=Populus trichocarpa TaxID=3694 RepID=A0A3N7EQ28_POPTR|eukprot:XP_024453033.1 probable serine/threonine-protein kinase PBL5 [Populus trichocarpa]
MSEGVQRVVVIQDASRDMSPIAIRLVLNGFSLKPGDAIILFGVLHQVNNPMGYRFKVDSKSMFGANPKFIEEEVSRKTEEYVNNVEILEIAKQCEMEQIEFRVEVRAGSTPKELALKAAKIFRATWVILDRQMKKDKRYFMDKLPCGISRMKRNNTIEQLRGSKTRENIKVNEKEEERVPYDEMIPGSPKRRRSARKPPAPPSTGAVREQQFNHGEEITPENHGRSDSFSKSASTSQFMMTTASSSTSTTGYHEHDTSSSTSKTAKHAYMNFQGKENTANTQQATAGKHSLAENTKFEQKEREAESLNEQQRRQKNIDNWMGESPTDEVFKNSICLVCKNRRPKIGWKRDFSYKEIHSATEGFSQTKFLSEGGFGSVYRGDLDGLAFAVKQHNSASFQGEKEFKSEVEVLSKARHENLVMLLGSCSEGNDRLLVYEYVCNGSLDQHLSKHARKPLTWEKRMKIALGAARGLKYLHENNIIHRDMRPNNILITHDHEALLGDFGLARTQHEDSEPSLETRVVGTLGYLAPEYAECGKVSTKTDVYAFGVVLLQLITGLKTTDKILGGKSLVGWARPLLKERNYPDLIDQRILESHDVHQLFWMVRVAEKCLSKDPQKRLTMDKVVYALNYIIESNSTCSLGELTPAKSDSPSSVQDSYESYDDTTSFTIETFSPGFPTDTTSTSSTSPRLPPSPPINFFHHLHY